MTTAEERSTLAALSPLWATDALPSDWTVLRATWCGDARAWCAHAELVPPRAASSILTALGPLASAWVDRFPSARLERGQRCLRVLAPDRYAGVLARRDLVECVLSSTSPALLLAAQAALEELDGLPGRVNRLIKEIGERCDTPLNAGALASLPPSWRPVHRARPPTDVAAVGAGALIALYSIVDHAPFTLLLDASVRRAGRAQARERFPRADVWPVAVEGTGDWWVVDATEVGIDDPWVFMLSPDWDDGPGKRRLSQWIEAVRIVATATAQHADGERVDADAVESAVEAVAPGLVDVGLDFRCTLDALRDDSEE